MRHAHPVEDPNLVLTTWCSDQSRGPHQEGPKHEKLWELCVAVQPRSHPQLSVYSVYRVVMLEASDILFLTNACTVGDSLKQLKRLFRHPNETSEWKGSAFFNSNFQSSKLGGVCVWSQLTRRVYIARNVWVSLWSSLGHLLVGEFAQLSLMFTRGGLILEIIKLKK